MPRPGQNLHINPFSSLSIDPSSYPFPFEARNMQEDGSMTPFLRFLIIQGPCPPRTLSPQDPFTLLPKMQKPSKNASQLLFFLSPWVRGCSFKAPEQCKNASFLFPRTENIVKLQVKGLSLGPGVPNNSKLGSLEML